MKTWTATLVLALIIGIPTAAPAGRDDAAQKVCQGIDRYREGEYAAAAEAFSEADVSLPDDPHIAFDRACAYAAAGDAEQARALFQQAAMSRDKALVAQCHYNLGCLAVAEGRGVFQSTPEDAGADERQEALARMHQAIVHFRDCLELDPAHDDARHNLELVRLWIKHMTALWEERDRRNQRENMDLLQFLEMIQAKQEALRLVTKSLERAPPSPRRREELRTAASAQRKLAEEIAPLKEKIRTAAQTGVPAGSPGGAAGAAPAPLISGPDAQQTVDRLLAVADEGGRAMRTASGKLLRRAPADAEPEQRKALERLDEIYREVVPFLSLVQKATAVEQGLVDASVQAVEEPDEQREPLDGDQAAWQQEFVARWAAAFGEKAQTELAQIEAAGSAVPPQPAGPQKPAPGAPDPAERLEAMKRPLNKAIENGPKIESLCRDAVGLLRDEKTKQALPKQEQALKLLKEILDQLPKQKQQQDQQKDEQQDDQQQQQDKDRQQEEEKRQKQPKPDPAKERAEAVLQRARQRQKEHRDEEKQRRRAMYLPAEKDW